MILLELRRDSLLACRISPYNQRRVPGSSPFPFWPLSLDYLSWGGAVAPFLILALPIVWLALSCVPRPRSRSPLDDRCVSTGGAGVGGPDLGGAPARKESMICRSLSCATTALATDQSLPEKSLDASVDAWLRAATASDLKPPEDRIGVIRFARDAQIQSMPARHFFTGAAAIADPAFRNATNVAGALRLATSTLSGDALHRIVLLWDGNATTGASTRRRAKRRPVRFLLMSCRLNTNSREVIAERLDAPAAKREGEPFSVRFTLRSTSAERVKGPIVLRDRGRSLDLDPRSLGFRRLLSRLRRALT